MNKITKIVFYPFLKLFFLALISTLFVIIMQLYMLYFSNFIGKGISFFTYFELSFYIGSAALSHVLPISIMFSSIVSIGNISENLELTALKASGISLFRIIRPLILFSFFLCFFSLFLNKNYIPKVYIKFITLLKDMQNKKPDISIKEGIFYDGIPGYSIRIGKKNKEKKILEDIIIYDHTRENSLPITTVAKEGKMYFEKNEKVFVFELLDGENLIDIKDEDCKDYICDTKRFIRSNFKMQKLMINLESLGFKRSDEEQNKDFKKSKTASILKKDIESFLSESKNLQNNIYKNILSYFYEIEKISLYEKREILNEKNSINNFKNLNEEKKKEIISKSLSSASKVSKYLKGCNREEKKKKIIINDYKIELNKMMSWAFSCISVMILGTCLGMLIKKGGFGIPLIISGFLIVIHYIIEMISEKWGKFGYIDTFSGAWASNYVIIPLCIIFYYMAYRDYSILDFNFFKIFKRKNKN